MEKEPFKIKFNTVVIIVCVLLAIIGILAFNLRRLEDTLAKSNINNEDNEYGNGLSVGLSGINDYDYFSENYKKALTAVFENNEENSNLFGEPSIIVLAPDSDSLGVYSITIDKLRDAYLNIPQNSPLYKKYGKITKISSNVLDAAVCHTGNGDLFDVFFINEDGTVSKLVDSNKRDNGVTLSGDLSLEKVSNLAGIVKIITVPLVNAEEPGFVDINGNIFDVSGKAFE